MAIPCENSELPEIKTNRIIKKIFFILNMRQNYLCNITKL
jgi:hypothetical protein